ncbi:MAG: VCBS repeat-containing protein, partial [Planctomycetota bacterium]
MLQRSRIAFALALSVSSARAQVPWTEVEVASGLPFASPGAIRLGDVDGDGDTDVVVANAASQALVWFESRAGQPSVQHVLEANAPGVLALELADIDGDGDLDVLACWFETLAWLENLGAGASFARRPIPQPFQAAPETGVHALLRDLDGDGDQDLVLSTTGNTGGYLRSLHAYRFDPTGYARVATLVGAQDLGRPTFADLDGDGDMDVVAPSASFTPAVWFRNDTAVGGPIALVPTGDTPFARFPLPTDFDGDGQVDLILVQSNYVAWSRNLGGGAFSGLTTLVPPALQPGSSFINQGELADLDGDGDDDLVLSIRPTNATSTGTLVRVAWYENDGNGGLGARQDLVADPFHEAFFGFAVGDFDGDGDFDVVATDRTVSTADVVAYLNGSALGAAVCAGAPNSTGAAGDLQLTGS